MTFYKKDYKNKFKLNLFTYQCSESNLHFTRMAIKNNAKLNLFRYNL